MRKKLLIALIAVAVPIYIWNAFLLFEAAGGSTGSSNDSKLRRRSTSGVVREPTTVSFERRGKSPFAAYEAKPKPKKTPPAAPARKRTTRKPTVQKPDVKRPVISVTGIMWNESNPVAMIELPGGSSTVTKPGDSHPGGITVVSVEKTRIQVKWQSQTWYVEK